MKALLLFHIRVGEVPPSDALRDLACRLIRVHPLRAGGSQQLAAALAACEYETAALEFVCLDERLRMAADREGLRCTLSPTARLKSRFRTVPQAPCGAPGDA